MVLPCFLNFGDRNFKFKKRGPGSLTSRPVVRDRLFVGTEQLEYLKMLSLI